MTLHFIGGKTAECEITKQGKKYIYFKTKGLYGMKYRVETETGLVQIAPYWNTEKRMSVEF